MLSINDTMEAIHQLAQDGIPELAYIVEDYVPQNMERPAWLTEYVTTVYKDAAALLVSVTQHFAITVFVDADHESRSKTRELLALQEKALNLFLPGYLPVKDRAIRVKASSAGRDIDKAYVDIQLEYLDTRGEIKEDAPLAGDLNIKL